MDSTNDENDILTSLKGIFQGIGIGIGYILISMSMMSNIVREKELNLKNQMRISGLSLPAYWIGHYISDVVFSMITTGTILILMGVYDAKVVGGPVLILLMSLANPIFIYVASSFFFNANNARNGILFIYLFIGVIVPFILPLIQFINKSTFDAV